MVETLEDLARECAERIWSIDNSGYLDGSRIGQYSNLILSTLSKAVEHERERCAKVAETAKWEQVCNDPHHDDRWCATCRAAEDALDMAQQQLATAIRSLT